VAHPDVKRLGRIGGRSDLRTGPRGQKEIDALGITNPLLSKERQNTGKNVKSRPCGPQKGKKRKRPDRLWKEGNGEKLKAEAVFWGGGEGEGPRGGKRSAIRPKRHSDFVMGTMEPAWDESPEFAHKGSSKRAPRSAEPERGDPTKEIS